MNPHTFTLILSGIAELTPERADALYAATQGDIELNLRDGVGFVEVERTTATLREAITTAIREVEQAMVGVRVLHSEWGSLEKPNFRSYIPGDSWERQTLKRRIAFGVLGYLGSSRACVRHNHDREERSQSQNAHQSRCWSKPSMKKLAELRDIVAFAF